MNKAELNDKLAEILEVEVEELIDDRSLDEYESWDSVAVLSVISLYTDITGKFIHASEILKIQTVGDLLSFLLSA